MLAITGHARLGGTLRLSLLGDFVPQPGDRFEIMTFASSEGQFLTADISAIPAGIGLVPEYGQTGVTLLAIDAGADPVSGAGSCGASCGPMGLMPMLLTLLGLCGLRVLRSPRG